MRSSVEFWYRRISFNASAPGRNLFVLLFSLFLSTVFLFSCAFFGGIPDRVEMSIGGRSRVGAVAWRVLIVFLAVCLKRALVVDRYHGASRFFQEFGLWTHKVYGSICCKTYRETPQRRIVAAQGVIDVSPSEPSLDRFVGQDLKYSKFLHGASSLCLGRNSNSNFKFYQTIELSRYKTRDSQNAHPMPSLDGQRINRRN